MGEEIQMTGLASLAPARDGVIRVAGRDVFYTEFGQGPAVLMLHGGGPGASGLSNYSRNIEALARQFRVIVPDMPGYGKSSKVIDSSDPFGDLATVMLAFMDALGIERASIVGNSLGGATALKMALEAPARVDRLVLMGPGGIATTKVEPTAGIKKLIGYYAGEGPTREKLADFIRNFLVADGSTVSDDLIDARFQDSLDPEVVANPPLRPPANAEAVARLDLCLDPRLARLAQPTLVLWGADDGVNRPSGGYWLQENLPDCDLYLFARTGHWVQWERAEIFNAVAATFLSTER
jgi:4,5:9,10-diseco-3-hydroxy-5,9,17-trioxoandrosta-1(10),2-diene-4-oate hydrolase